MRSKEEVTKEEYNKFYKIISKDRLDPLAYTHFNAEGEIEFKSILFLPKKAPLVIMDNWYTKKSEVKLFVRGVWVPGNFDELMPPYLNFVHGVVEFDDFPLNVSLEQQNKMMKVISKKLVSKVLELIKKLAKKDDGDEEDAKTKTMTRRRLRTRKKKKKRIIRTRSPHGRSFGRSSA